MTNDQIMYLLIGVVALFVIVLITYLVIRKKMQSSGYREIQQLREGTREKNFSMEVLYQKLYVRYTKLPFVKRYILKIRRRLEIINIDDEYLTRRQAAEILTRAIAIIIPLTIVIIWLTHENYLLMSFLLILKYLWLIH